MRPAFFLLILMNDVAAPSSPIPQVSCGYQLPHCLKWKATPAFTHWSRRRRIQSGCVGRARPPLSPPAMIQCSPPMYADRSTGAQKRLAAQESISTGNVQQKTDPAISEELVLDGGSEPDMGWPSTGPRR